MEKLDLNEMQEMQNKLQEKYINEWGGLYPKKAREMMLWMYGEMAEAADIIKKNGDDDIMNDEHVRTHFIEEMCDVLMFWNDVVLCYGITPEEIEKIYREKNLFNMNRWKHNDTK